MCELLAMSSRLPTRLTFSLETLAQHGSPLGPQRDGWGVAFYDGRDAHLFREPRAAGDSALVRFIEGEGPESVLVISHIRRATRGRRSLANTQPFARELGGRLHVFAHNGDLEGLQDNPAFMAKRFLPLGETDSEAAFCALLERLAPLWTRGGAVPPLEDRLDVVAGLGHDLRALGPANFLYGDGDALFAHGDRRRHADGAIGPPGLCLLRRLCPANAKAAAAAGVRLTPPEQEVLLFASVPLTDEPWQPLEEGAVIAAAGGRVVARTAP